MSLFCEQGNVHKIQHLFMGKNTNKLEENFVKVVKVIYTDLELPLYLMLKD